MLNCLFFRIFSSVSFVSLYQTKAQRSGFCLELRSKGAERGMPSPARRYTRSGLCDEVVGMGFCPIWGIWRGAGAPATSQMRCWLLPNGRIFPAAAGFFCAGLPYCAYIFHVARTSAQRGAVWHTRAHTRSLLGKPHTAATHASRCAPGVRHTRRVDRDDYFHGGKIGTIDPFQADEAFSVALSKRD